MLYGYVVLVVLLLTCPLDAIEEHAVFRDMKLFLDANPAPGNQAYEEIDLPSVGAMFSVQMFVPGAAGMQTLGFSVEFVLLGDGETSRTMQLESGQAFDGTALTLENTNGRVNAMLISRPTIPVSGYIGTVMWQVTRKLENTDILIGYRGSMGDPANDVDFADFLKFTTNFGKVGPVPTDPFCSGQDVITITETVTVHDTVYVETGETPQLRRGRDMLGFWHFGLGLSAEGPAAVRQGFIFGWLIEPDDPIFQGEYTVIGAASDGSIA